VTLDCIPGFDGLADLLPTKRFRGLAALVDPVEPGVDVGAIMDKMD